MIYFVRHGETDWNVLLKCQGRKDLPLNENGIKQAQAVAKDLANVKIDAYFCSPMLRTRQTFENAVGRKPKRAELDERLIERDFGEFEGLKRDEFDFAGFCNIKSNQKFEKAESIFDVEKRAKSFLEFINKKYKDKNVLVISHGGFGIVFKSLIEGTPNDGDYLHVEMPHGSIVLLDNSKCVGEERIMPS